MGIAAVRPPVAISLPAYLCVSSDHGLKFGDPVNLPPGTVVTPCGKAIVDLGGGKFVYVQYVMAGSKPARSGLEAGAKRADAV